MAKFKAGDIVRITSDKLAIKQLIAGEFFGCEKCAGRLAVVTNIWEQDPEYSGETTNLRPTEIDISLKILPDEDWWFDDDLLELVESSNDS